MAEEKGTQRLSKRALARLIKKGMKGDREAFAELYKAFICTIYYNVSTSLVNKSEVEDAVQQVVISLYKGLSNLKSPYAFHSYLFRVTMNVCNDYNQKEARQRHVTLEDIEQELIDDMNEEPPQVLENKDRDELVRFFISRLPNKQRYALLLYYYYDMPYKNIAEVMDTTVTVVGSNINRAKRNLKRMLEEHENRLSAVDSGEESFRGISVDTLFVSAFATATGQALSPSKVELLWQKCCEQMPEIAGIVASTTATVSSVAKSIVAGVLAAGVVIGAGAYVIHYKINMPIAPTGVVTETVTSQSHLFTPKSVSINMESRNPNYPETFNPIFAEIELSEGFPLEWYIRDESGTIIKQGTSQIIGLEVLDTLLVGVYQVDWLISNEAGDTGVASRVFSIVDESSFP